MNIRPHRYQIVIIMLAAVFRDSTAPGDNNARKWRPRDGKPNDNNNRNNLNSACFARS
jgi:hypothetical protein